MSILIDCLLHFSQEPCYHLLKDLFICFDHFKVWQSLHESKVNSVVTIMPQGGAFIHEYIFSSGTDLNGSMGPGGLQGRFISLII